MKARLACQLPKTQKVSSNHLQEKDLLRAAERLPGAKAWPVRLGVWNSSYRYVAEEFWGLMCTNRRGRAGRSWWNCSIQPSKPAQTSHYHLPTCRLMLLAFEASLMTARPQQMPGRYGDHRDSGQCLGLEGPTFVERPSSYCLVGTFFQILVDDSVSLSFLRYSSVQTSKICTQDSSECLFEWFSG